MMQVGDRVQVKGDNAHYPNKRGYVVGEADREFGFDWDVVMDGDKVPVSFKESDLLPVEVVVLEGPIHITNNGAVQVGDTYIDDVVREDEDVRITIERVKREG